jgi:hypothetical protein
MGLMAAVTGGRVIRNTNGLANGARRAAAGMRGSYSLGFYVSEEPDGKWHGIKVSVSRPGVTLRYRQGYLAEGPAAMTQDWPLERWQVVVSDPLGSTAIPMDAYCEPYPGDEPGTLNLVLRVELVNLSMRQVQNHLVGPLMIGIAEKTAEGAAMLEQRPALIPLTREQLLQGGGDRGEVYTAVEAPPRDRGNAAGGGGPAHGPVRHAGPAAEKDREVTAPGPQRLVWSKLKRMPVV